MKREDVRDLINEHRRATGHQPFTAEEAAKKFPGVELMEELKRVESIAQFGDDPWAKHHVTVKNSIFDYFEEKLGVKPNDYSLKSLPVASNCGDDCKKAIDQAAWLIEMVGPIDRVRIPMIAATNAAVEVFWRG